MAAGPARAGPPADGDGQSAGAALADGDGQSAGAALADGDGQGAIADDEEDAECEDLLHIIALGARQTAMFEQRSPALLKHARAAKKRKELERKLENAYKRQKQIEKKHAMMAAKNGTSASSLSSSSLSCLSKEELVMVQCAVASGPTARGSSGAIQAQARAAADIASVALDLQAKVVRDWCSPRERRCVASTSLAASTVLVYSHEWDETSQRVRSARKILSGKVRAGAAQRSSQIMVQHGALHVFEGTGPHNCHHVQQPVFVRSLTLMGSKANHILEGLLKGIPMNLEDTDFMKHSASRCEAFVMAFACDRAAANISLLHTLMPKLTAIADNVLPVCEPCNAHGCALAKSRCVLGKKSAGALVSFTKLLRQGNVYEALRNKICERIRRGLQIRRQCRPPKFHDRVAQLIDYVASRDEVGPDGESHFYTTDKHGALSDSPWLKDLKEWGKGVPLSDLLDCSPLPSYPAVQCSHTLDASGVGGFYQLKLQKTRCQHSAFQRNCRKLYAKTTISNEIIKSLMRKL